MSLPASEGGTPLSRRLDTSTPALDCLWAPALGTNGELASRWVWASGSGSAGTAKLGRKPMAPITTPFGARSTAEEVVAGCSLSGRRIIVTGAASGIGIETARALALTGAEVTLAVRNLTAGAETAASLAASTGNPNIRAVHLDLSVLASVSAFVADWHGPLHVLVNNAGVMALPELQHTPEGYELQFATNHLGHFALALGLRPALAAAGAARIVSVSSSAHLRSPVVFDDIHFARRPYQPILAYAQSKTANMLFAVAANARWQVDGITANALHPGGIPTNLQRHTGGMKTPPERRKTPQQGAATSALLATSPPLEGVGGRYFEDCNEALVASPGETTHGVAPYALDSDDAKRLWEASLNMLRGRA